MRTTEIQLRLETAAHLINEIRFAENVLDELFFSRPTISVAPPPVDFFHSYTSSAFNTIQQAKDAYMRNDDVESNAGRTENDSYSPTVPNLSESDIRYPDNFGEIIGQRIRDKRTIAGITQKQLAEETGIKRPNIARLEKGQSLPNLATLLKVSSALHISLQELLSI